MTKVTIDREERYTVIKHKDLTADDRSDLDQLIQSRHIPTRKCLVIESDWPEYEPVWRMIEARVTGASTKPTKRCRFCEPLYTAQQQPKQDVVGAVTGEDEMLSDALADIATHDKK